jgi:hypothetical protein
MRTKCVVACTNAEGCPDFYFCTVECSGSDYDAGRHYDAARKSARDEGYEGEMVVFDENDGPDFLFNHFVWESATTVKG